MHLSTSEQSVPTSRHHPVIRNIARGIPHHNSHRSSRSRRAPQHRRGISDALTRTGGNYCRPRSAPQGTFPAANKLKDVMCGHVARWVRRHRENKTNEKRVDPPAKRRCSAQGGMSCSPQLASPWHGCRPFFRCPPTAKPSCAKPSCVDTPNAVRQLAMTALPTS